MKPAQRNTTDAGRRWEEVASRHLVSMGMTEVERNFRGRTGEIDLIMREGEALVFVEVRYRGPGPVRAAESIDRRKIRRIVTQVNRYVQEKGHTGPCRIDVVAIDGSSDGTWSIEHLVSAIEG